MLTWHSQKQEVEESEGAAAHPAGQGLRKKILNKSTKLKKNF